jgi:hypothetical protein
MLLQSIYMSWPTVCLPDAVSAGLVQRLFHLRAQVTRVWRDPTRQFPVGGANVLEQQRHEAHPLTTYANYSSHRSSEACSQRSWKSGSSEAYPQRSYVHAPKEAGVAALNDCPVGTRNDRRREAVYAPEYPSSVCGSSEVDETSDSERRSWQMANPGQSEY